LHVLRDAKCPAMPDQWRVADLNASEQAVAARLLAARAEALNELAGGAVRWSMLFGYLVADNNYDTNALYDLAMGLLGLQLIAPPQPSAAGLGHHRHSPFRLRGLDLCRGVARRRLRRDDKAVAKAEGGGKKKAANGPAGQRADQDESSRYNKNASRRHPLNPLGRPDVPPTFGQTLLAARGGIERSFGLWGNGGGGLSPLPNWVRRPRRVALWVAGKIMFNGARYALKHGLLPTQQNKGLAT
jgi:hypothetical protein